MTRVFSAIELPVSIRDAVESYSIDLAGESTASAVKWVRADRLHLTVRFFGNVDESTLELIRDAYGNVSAVYEPFRLALEGTGVFPSKRRPKVLWLGLSGIEPLRLLKTAADEKLVSAGIDPENRPYRPHLTIARLRDPSNAVDVVLRHLSQDFGPAGFSVARIVLIESVLKPEGPEYSEIDSAELRG